MPRTKSNRVQLFIAIINTQFDVDTEAVSQYSINYMHLHNGSLSFQSYDAVTKYSSKTLDALIKSLL